MARAPQSVYRDGVHINFGLAPIGQPTTQPHTCTVLASEESGIVLKTIACDAKEKKMASRPL